MKVYVVINGERRNIKLYYTSKATQNITCVSVMTWKLCTL